MGKIFCLMGKSSSGKDTLYKSILGEKCLHLENIVPYTTRPIRVFETEGIEYHFTDKKQYLRLKEEGKIIEARAYDTMHGIWYYFTADDGQVDLDRKSYLMIGTLESYQKLRDYFGAAAVLPIYIEVEDGVRLQRALDRERVQDTPKYSEMCRRFLADEADFSEDNLKIAGVRQRFINEDLEKIKEEIIRYIKAEVKNGY